MKASRAAIKTAKAVKTVEERLAAVEERLTTMEEILEQLAATFGELCVALATDRAGTEKVLQQLVAAVSADKPSTAAEALGKPGAPKARTARKRGGGA